MTMPKAATLALTFFILSSCAGNAGGQPADRPRPSREVPFEMVSAEIHRFENPVRIGAGSRAIRYDEALVFKIAVDRGRYDSLPPDIEPFFYIGAVELHTFHIDRKASARQLILTFHATDWERLREGAPMVLTIDHGAPARDPARFREAPRFSRRLIVDRRR
jgi:hypothetical protein